MISTSGSSVVYRSINAPTADERQGAYPPAVSRATRRRLLGAMAGSLGHPTKFSASLRYFARPQAVSYAGRHRLRVHGLGSVTRARRRVTVGLVARPTAYRLERPGEGGGVGAVVRAAFGAPEGVDRIVDDLRASDAWTGLSYVAESEGQIVRHVSFTRSLLDAPNRLVEVLVLSPLSVLPGRQGRGIGSALVRYALDE